MMRMMHILLAIFTMLTVLSSCRKQPAPPEPAEAGEKGQASTADAVTIFNETAQTAEGTMTFGSTIPEETEPWDIMDSIFASPEAVIRPRDVSQRQRTDVRRKSSEFDSISEITDEMILKNEVGYNIDTCLWQPIDNGYYARNRDYNGMMDILRVEATEECGAVIYQTVTDPEGEYRLCLITGDEVISLTGQETVVTLAPGYSYISLIGLGFGGAVKIQVYSVDEIDLGIPWLMDVSS